MVVLRHPATCLKGKERGRMERERRREGGRREGGNCCFVTRFVVQNVSVCLVSGFSCLQFSCKTVLCK